MVQFGDELTRVLQYLVSVSLVMIGNDSKYKWTCESESVMASFRFVLYLLTVHDKRHMKTSTTPRRDWIIYHESQYR